MRRAKLKELACALARLSGGLCISTLVWSVAACDPGPRGPSQLASEFVVDAEVYPEWPPTTDRQTLMEEPVDESDPKALVIYLDLSRPMAGFLPLSGSAPREGAAATNEFRAVSQWVPDHLTRVYSTANLQWRGVGRDIRDLSQYPQFERTLFSATASRLDLAIQEALTGLQSGRSEGVAIISDLLGTGELTGALAVSRYLSNWLESEDVRSGEYHLGLVGVKASYWGATAPACPARGGFGCWYSERGLGWRRLGGLAVAPFYILLMGRDAESMSTILRSIQADAESVGIETVAELLTMSTLGRPDQLACEAFALEGGERTDQYALRRAPSGEYACVRNDPVKLVCDFQGGFVPTAARIDEPDGGPIGAFEVAVAGGGAQLSVDVDCGMVRENPDQDLLLDVAGTFNDGAATPAWEEWSIETDDLPAFPGKTLQLRYFIEEVRVVPEGYRVVLPPILRGRRP